MSSLVELVFTAVGTEVAASSVDKVSGSLGTMTRELGQMAVAALSVNKAVEGVKGALNDGDMFSNLSLRVGETVRELVVLDTWFENSSMGRGAIAQSAGLLQRALGGVNEMGGKTEVAFRRVGTSIEELKPLQFTQQLRILSEGFAGLENQSERTNVAMQLFGRSGGQMLQLLGDPEGLAQAEQQAGRLGDRMERDAKAFDAVGDRLNVINTRFKEMWVVAAEQVLPTLNGIARVFEGMNLSGLGAFLGAAGPGALGMVAMTSAFDFADRRLYKLLENMQEGTARSMVRGVSNAMGMAALWTPVALAAGVTAQIVLGVIAAWQDSQVQKIYEDMRKVTGVSQPLRDEFKRQTTSEGQQDTIGSTTKKLEELRIARVELEKAMSTASDGVKSIANVALNGSGIAQMLASTTTIKNTYSVGGKERDYTKDLRDARVLNEQITKLSGDLQNLFENATARGQSLAAAQLAATKASLAPLVAQLAILREKNEKLLLETMDPAQQASVLQGKRAMLEGKLAAPLAPGVSSEDTEAYRLNLQNQILEIKKQEAEVNAKLQEQAKQQVDADFKRAVYAKEVQMAEAKAGGDESGMQRLKVEIDEMRARHELAGADLELFNRMAAAKQKEWDQEQARTAERRKMESEKNALDAALDRIRENLANIDGNFSTTAAEKWPLRRQQMDEEIKRLEDMVKLEGDRANAARAKGDEPSALKHEGAARDYGQQLTGARGARAGQGANPNSLADQLTDKMNRAREAMGTWQETIASGFSQAFTNASAGMQQLIGDTEYWTGKLGNIAGPIMGSITKAIADMFTTWIVQRGFAAVKNMMFSAEEGAADTAAKTPGAVLSSISSFGVAAAVGVAAIVAAMAAFGGFREAGGDALAGVPYIVGERRPEVFVPRVNGTIVPSVSAYAMSLPAPRSMGSQGRGSPAAAALQPASRAHGSDSSGGGESSRARQPKVYVLMDRQQFSRAMQEDSTAYFQDLTETVLRKNS